MFEIATFYRFIPLDDLPRLRAWLLELAAPLELRGTLLLAPEGLNATICGSKSALGTFFEALEREPSFADLPIKWSRSSGDAPVFLRFKVKIKNEIVTMGVPGVQVAAHTAEHVVAADFNRLLDDPGVVVLDVRNRYETEIGTFRGAEDPETDSFREFPSFVAERFGSRRDQPIAMFCTGGIRCEKASAYLVEQGFKQVYQLDGGILKYLEETPAEKSRWEGECFVFDQRVTVDHSLAPGDHVQCHACRRPVSPADQKSPLYQVGVACPGCAAERKSSARAGFAERQRQIELAEARGTQHLGPDSQPDA